MSVGAQVGGEVGGGATMDHGVATIGVEGEVALLVGVDVDLSVSVDTKPAQEFVVDTGNTVAKTVTKDANTVAKETTKVVDKTVDVAKDAGNSISKGASNAGKKLKKKFKF